MLSIEAFIGVNLLMNLVVFGLAARSLGHVRWKRLLAAALTGTGYALLAYGAASGLLSSVGQVLCLPVIAWILAGGRRRMMLRSLVCVAAGMLFAGGVMQLLSQRLSSGGPAMVLGGCAATAAAALAAGGVRRRALEEQRIRLRIGTRMGKTEVDALVDTGNRLREPLSGLPVVIVGRRSLAGLLDPSCLGTLPDRLPPGFRVVRYGVLGGQGEMLCFRPESVCIRAGDAWLPAPDIWVAVYPDEMPSAVEALAPPVFGRAGGY